MRRQIYNKNTKQLRIDTELHRLLKIHASRLGKSMRALAEEKLKEIFDEPGGTEDGR